MKAIIIDTNILFSALLGKNEKFRDILLATEKVKLYTSKYALVELFKCKDIDEKDIPFVAITIELNGALWTGDKKTNYRFEN